MTEKKNLRLITQKDIDLIKKITIEEYKEDLRKLKEKESKKKAEEEELKQKQKDLEEKIRQDVLDTEIKLLKKSLDLKNPRIPRRFKKPIDSLITVFSPGGGSSIFPAKEISSEWVDILREKEDKKDPYENLVYMGVPPDIQDQKIKGIFNNGFKISRMHYIRHGHPFTYNPRDGRIFTDERKRAIIMERGIGCYMEVGEKRIVVLLDWETGFPEFKDKLKEKEFLKSVYSNYETVTDTKDLERSKDFPGVEEWLKKNIKTEGIYIIDLPIVTEYDVTDIEAMKDEFAKFIEKECIEYFHETATNPIRQEKTLIKLLVVGIMLMPLLMTLMFLLFISQGQFII